MQKTPNPVNWGSIGTLRPAYLSCRAEALASMAGFWEMGEQQGDAVGMGYAIKTACWSISQRRSSQSNVAVAELGSMVNSAGARY